MSSFKSKTALLGGILDYAGTFPPARLPLSDALKESVAFRNNGKHPWLSTRMALGVQDLRQVTEDLLLSVAGPGTTWVFTAIAAKGDEATQSTYLRSVESDLEVIDGFNEVGRHGICRRFINAYETKLPSQPQIAQQTVGEVVQLLSMHAKGIRPIFEIDLSGPWRERLAGVAQSIQNRPDHENKRGSQPGLKVRTGGADAASAEQLCRVISECASYSMCFKATQGLHEALSHDGAFGFLNVFSALNYHWILGESKFGKIEILELLSDPDPGAFDFGERYLRWRNHRISIDEIEAARQEHQGCFGSCSLSEPDESLSRFFSNQML